MNKLFSSTVMCPLLKTLIGIGFTLPSLAEKPSLDDGIICVAGKRGSFYYTTSTIDAASLNDKQPVSVRILQRQGAIGVSDVAFYDRTKNSLTVADMESVREYTPEAVPVGSGALTYTGNNTFTGKSATGAPMSFTLSKDNSVITLTHAGRTAKGICR